jgi:hypothetical protein
MVINNLIEGDATTNLLPQGFVGEPTEGTFVGNFGVSASTRSPDVRREHPSEETMPDNPTKDEVQAQIAASEARSETRLARLEGKIDALTATLVGKIDALSDKVSVADAYNRQSRFWIIATIVAALGLFVAFAAYTDTIFGRGMNVRDVIQTTIKETLAQQPPHDTTDKKDEKKGP